MIGIDTSTTVVPYIGANLLLSRLRLAKNRAIELFRPNEINFSKTAASTDLQMTNL